MVNSIEFIGIMVEPEFAKLMVKFDVCPSWISFATKLAPVTAGSANWHMPTEMLKINKVKVVIMCLIFLILLLTV